MEALNSKEAVEEAIGWSHKPGITWEPKDWTVDSLTGGCFSTFTRVLPPLYYQATGAGEQDIPQQGTWAELHELAGVPLTADSLLMNLPFDFPLYGEYRGAHIEIRGYGEEYGELRPASFYASMVRTLHEASGASADTTIYLAIWPSFGMTYDRIFSDSGADLPHEQAEKSGLIWGFPPRAGRDYVIFQARLGELTADTWMQDAGFSTSETGRLVRPCYIWAADRNWLICADMDWDSAVIATELQLAAPVRTSTLETLSLTGRENLY